MGKNIKKHETIGKDETLCFQSIGEQLLDNKQLSKTWEYESLLPSHFFTRDFTGENQKIFGSTDPLIVMQMQPIISNFRHRTSRKKSHKTRRD